MTSRSTLVGALVCAELAIVGLALWALGAVRGPSAALAVGGTAIGGFPAAGVPASRIDRRFPAGPTPHVVVEVSDADVSVTAGAAGEVHVVAESRRLGWARGVAGGFIVTPTADGLRVTEPPSAGPRLAFGTWERRVVITVPPAAALDAQTGDGDLELAGLRGTIHGSTGDGTIRARQIALDDGSLRSGDGDVRVVALPGADAVVHLHTGDGDLNLVGVHAQSGADGDDAHDMTLRLGNGRGTFSIETGDGSITLDGGAAG